jgi:hypothetical protein
MPALYIDPLQVFLDINAEYLLGKLTSGLAKEGFDTTMLTTLSWLREIAELQAAFSQLLDLLPSATRWPILFEYVLPIVGQRVDCVLLADDMIYVVEYKGGSSASAHAALQQAQEYALNLIDFHEASRHRTAIPIAVGAFKTSIPLDLKSEHHGAAVSLIEFPDTIVRSHRMWGGKSAPIDASEWNNSRYFPVPTIVQAASAIYRDHNVKDLAYSRAGSDNLETTQKAVASSVRDTRLRGVKKLLVITGVPGAGKTLAGLNAVQLLAQELDLDVEQASFLSGNGPLVAVIQEALKRSIGSRKKGLARSVRSRIREIHRFVRDSYGDSRAPADRIIVFDEAQRAWTAAKNLKKFGRNVSEPEMVLDIMGRHDGWAVIVALVGGGQEIHGGEAGLAAWGDAIAKHPEWEVITSPEAVLGGPSVAGSRLFCEGYSEVTKVERDPALHLAISNRSYETDVTAQWVNAVLHGQAEETTTLAFKGLPIHVTRDIQVARSWLLANAKGNRRAGLVASSGAARLRADCVETPTFQFLRGVDFVKWFLEPSGDHRSSNQLEVALSEFEMQGLEIDVAGLLWGGDLVFPEGRVVARSLRGRRWCVVDGVGDPQVSADDPRTRIQNKCRVLLTRFRKGMVIFVPPGSADDPTRAPVDFDSVYGYLLRCGVHPLT